MYYIHISLYRLVIPAPRIPPIPLVFSSCSKGPWHLLGAPYIPSAPFILIFVRGPRLASLANWSRLADPCCFSPSHFDHFGRCPGPPGPPCLCAFGKTPTWLGAPYHTWHFLFHLISPLWIPSPWFLRHGFRPPGDVLQVIPYTLSPCTVPTHLSNF